MFAAVLLQCAHWWQTQITALLYVVFGWCGLFCSSPFWCWSIDQWSTFDQRLVCLSVEGRRRRRGRRCLLKATFRWFIWRFVHTRRKVLNFKLPAFAGLLTTSSIVSLSFSPYPSRSLYSRQTLFLSSRSDMPTRPVPHSAVARRVVVCKQKQKGPTTSANLPAVNLLFPSSSSSPSGQTSRHHLPVRRVLLHSFRFFCFTKSVSQSLTHSVTLHTESSPKRFPLTAARWSSLFDHCGTRRTVLLWSPGDHQPAPVFLLSSTDFRVIFQSNLTSFLVQPLSLPKPLSRLSSFSRCKLFNCNMTGKKRIVGFHWHSPRLVSLIFSFSSYSHSPLEHHFFTHLCRTTKIISVAANTPNNWSLFCLSLVSMATPSSGTAKYHCNYCDEDIKKIRVRCAECPDFDLCLKVGGLGFLPTNFVSL